MNLHIAVYLDLDIIGVFVTSAKSHLLFPILFNYQKRLAKPEFFLLLITLLAKYSSIIFLKVISKHFLVKFVIVNPFILSYNNILLNILV